MDSTTAHSKTPEQWIEFLSEAITDEAEAMASANADELLDAVNRKEQAAEALEHLSEAETAGLDPLRLAALREANLANAALMQVAQAHACWALSQLGRLETGTTYTPSGQAIQTRPQYFGAA